MLRDTWNTAKKTRNWAFSRLVIHISSFVGACSLAIMGGALGVCVLLGIL